MMAIADIYDALTASDRPYKKAMPSKRRSTSCARSKAAGALDASLLDLFIDARIFDRTDWR